MARASSWYRGWRSRQALRRSLDAMDPDERRRMLTDAGLDAEAMSSVISRHPNANDLLHRLMAAIGIGQDELATGNPGALRDFERVCASCHDWRRCRRDLARGSAAERHHAYCPNAESLQAIKRSQMPGGLSRVAS
jgi:Family of unknown function (DUF6455)